jgi:hypothetical protein
VSKLLERYLSPGLMESDSPLARGLFKGYREATNGLNLFNLGLSGFHFLGTGLNAGLFEPIQNALVKASRGDIGSLRASDIPGWGLVERVMNGWKMQKEWYAPGSQGKDVADAMKSYVEGGGRAGMADMDRTSWYRGVRDALDEIKSGKILTGGGKFAAQLAPALMELINKPVMDKWVPWVKMGSAMTRMQYEMERMGRQGKAMDKDAVRQTMGRIGDSMDNRFGQVAYDNLFWHKSFKDLAMATIRAVGWNVGTWRELGGGVKDIPSSLRGLSQGEGISDRLAYVAALTFGSGLIGGLTHYALNGQGPDELKDYFFPKTGGKSKDGTPERLSFPTYLHHDVAPVLNRADEPYRLPGNLYKSFTGKISPAISMTPRIHSRGRPKTCLITF